MNNKKLRIIVDILLIVIGVVFLIFGIKDAVEFIKPKEQPDNVRFHDSYSTVGSKESVFDYVDLEEIEEILKSKEALIFVGNPLDPWSLSIAKPINDVISKAEKKAYYFENVDLDKESKKYKSVINKLEIDEFTNPTIILVKESQITILDYENLFESDYDGTPSEYWTEDNLDNFKNLIS